MGQVPHGSATIEPAWRHRFEPAARAHRQSSNKAIASFARAAVQGTRHQPEDGREVAPAGDG